MRYFFYEVYQLTHSIKVWAAVIILVFLSLVTSRSDRMYSQRDIEYSIRMAGEDTALKEFCDNTGLELETTTLDEAIAEQFRQQSYYMLFSVAGCIPMIGGFVLATAFISRDFYRRRFHYPLRGSYTRFSIWLTKCVLYELIVALFCTVWTVIFLFRYAAPAWAALDHGILLRNFLLLLALNLSVGAFQFMVGFLLRHPIPVVAVLYYVPILWTNLYNAKPFTSYDPFSVSLFRNDLFLQTADSTAITLSFIGAAVFFVICSGISWLAFRRAEFK